MTSERRLIHKSFDQIQRKCVSWLWYRRIPRGKISIIGGHPDVGKSLITIDMAARVSTGRAWPDGSGKAPLGNVLILSAEDDPEDTIGPRLDVHDADCSRVFRLTLEKGQQQSSLIMLNIDHGLLEHKIRELDAILVIVDPVMSFLGDKVKPNDEISARRVLEALRGVTERTEAAFVGIMHRNKKPDLAQIQQISGSMAWPAVVRSILFAERESQNENSVILSVLKMNVEEKPPALSYCFKRVLHPEIDSHVGKLEWNDQLIDPSDPGTQKAVPSESDRAIALLEEMLPEDGPNAPGCPTADLNARAKAEGISESTLQRARSKRGVVPRKVGDAWHLWLPPKDHKPPSKLDLFLNQSISLRDYGEGDEGDDGLEGLEGVDDVGGVNGT